MSRAEQYTDYRARGSGERARHGDGGRDQRHRRRKAQCMWWRARAWVHRGRGRGRRDHTFTDDELGACWSAQEIVRLYQLASARMVSCRVPRRRRSAKGAAVSTDFAMRGARKLVIGGAVGARAGLTARTWRAARLHWRAEGRGWGCYGGGLMTTGAVVQALFRGVSGSQQQRSGRRTTGPASERERD